MYRFHVPAGVAALAVSLASVLAPVESFDARAQEAVLPAAGIAHTQPAVADSPVQFVTREVVQAVPTEADAERTPDSRTASPKGAGSLSQLVTRMAGDRALDEQLHCLAGAIYFEARGEPLTGQLAVAEVIVNRSESGRFPGSYCGVVKQKSQFSFVRGGRIPAIPTGSATWQRAKAIALIADQGLWKSEADGALFFHARSVAPGWSGRKMAARISNHVFYR